MCRRRVDVVIFDMDGVLAECRSSWEYLHRAFNSLSYVSGDNYAEKFRRGLLSYEKWMMKDLEAMIKAKGGRIHRSEILKEIRKVKINPEAEDIVSFMLMRGVKVGIVSAGIYELASLIANKLGIKYVYANKLMYDRDGYLMPKGIGVVDPLRKDRVLHELSNKLGIPLSKFMYVGDSDWDISAFKVVGYPVLYTKDNSIVRRVRNFVSNVIVIDALHKLKNIICLR